ncbi:hypothetical protein JOQ06_012794 [Pogonophryne albipinna]|uniref:Ig-like domain-containing protein n=1 Tax=Pogonophryne albipinna TaxID=1090488 RepID=A0AAD6BID6_9TELE|nr:hypothetical protein JOQ06_012794 [Pogonophryne albipinna]
MFFHLILLVVSVMTTKNGTEITWKVNEMTEWINSTSCYYNNDTTDVQCCSVLPITVYKPPENVSFSVHPGVPMSEGQQYTLQCEVRDVAPVKNLRVTFYRGQAALGHTQSNINTDEKPVSEVFTLNITSTKEDDGVEFWCEAKLELGAEGPQPPPVVGSEKLTAAVHYLPSTTLPTTTTSTPSNTMITATSTPTTMITTTSTPPTTMITTTSTPTTTKTTTTATATTTTTPNRGTSSKRLHSFMMCFLLLFSALV